MNRYAEVMTTKACGSASGVAMIRGAVRRDF